MADNKKQEYRELLDALNHWYDIELPRISVLNSGGVVVEQGKDQETRYLATLAVDRLLKDRLFIAEKLRKAAILQEWKTIERMTDDLSNLSITEFEQSYSRLHNKLVSLAKSDTGIS